MQMTTKSIRSSPILEALFTSQARVEVLKLFFLRTSGRHYLREIATLTQQPVRAVQRELARLEDVEILQSTREGNRKYFQANRVSPVFSELRSLFVKTAGLGDILRRELQEGSGTIRAAFLFGSYARGTESSTSDVDLMVIGSITSRELSRLITPAKKNLGREINPIVMRVDEFREKVVKEHPFTQRVLQEPKMFLIGGENELRDLAGRRTT
jgi:predicted nucleotidyltransferase